MEKNDRQLAQKLSDSYNRLNLIFHAILAPPLVAFVWLYLESKSGSISPLLEDDAMTGIISLVFPIVVMGLIVGAFFLFKSALRKVDPVTKLMERMLNYTRVSIVLFGMLEMGLIFSVVGYYFTQKDIFLALYFVVLIFFSLYKPTLQRIASHLNIKGDEREFLINCRSIARGEEKEVVAGK